MDKTFLQRQIGGMLVFCSFFFLILPLRLPSPAGEFFPLLQLWLLFAAFVYAWPADKGFPERLCLKKLSGKEFFQITLLTFAVFWILLLFNYVLVLTGRKLGFAMESQELIEQLRHLPALQLAGCCFSSLILAPLTEELAFRHILFSTLRSSGIPLVSAVLLSAFCFTLLHGIRFQCLPLFLLALYLQWIYCRFRSTAASFLAHAWFNAFNVTGVLLARFLA